MGELEGVEEEVKDSNSMSSISRAAGSVGRGLGWWWRVGRNIGWEGIKGTCDRGLRIQFY